MVIYESRAKGLMIATIKWEPNVTDITETTRMRILVIFTVLTVVTAERKNYTGHRLISVHAKTNQDVELLMNLQENPGFEELDFWSEPTVHRPTDIRVSPNDYGKLRAALEKGNLMYNVAKDNVQEFIDEESSSMAKQTRNTAGCDHQNVYCTLSQIQVFLDDILSSYSSRVEMWTIGYSAYGGLPIYAVKIAENLNQPKNAIWIEAGTHAREWISVSSALNLIERLASNSDPQSALMLSKYDWYIAPVHNPDGYSYTHTNERLWRKNRQPCQGFGTGTDLNRNWDISFGGAGTSPFCSSDTYPGASAFSAPETAALRDAVLSTPNVFGFFSIHCYSQLMLVPYAHTSAKPARYNELADVANKMMTQLELVDKKYFQVGTPPDILYAASGGAYDYFYDAGVPWSYTYELRPASSAEGGFVLPTSQIPFATEELFISLFAFANMTLSW